MTMFRRLLIANRGEIACRIIRTCRRLGIETVAVYSEADADEPHVRDADRAVLIGPPAVSESYLRIDRIVAAAVETGCDAVHPGYGFLAERAAFAQAVIDAGLTFVGPSPHAIALMGDKAAAKRHVRDIGVPLVPGTEDDRLTDDELIAASGSIGLPLLIKAVAGGGGKGMRTVNDPAVLGEAIAAARREALSAFGDDRVLLERFVSRPRHIEIQVFGDTHGNVVHLLERECSVQRRHQKVVEECPSPALDEALRERMGAAAVAVAASVGYSGAGTVEFLVAGDTLDREQPEFYFLEMNTRLQVEHPVTEEVTGLDLVEMQLRVAAGETLPVRQDEVRRQGHAIEVRLYAEDPVAMLPQSGRIRALSVPDLAGFRADLGVAVGSEVGRFYDPMLGKLIVHAADRASACDLLGAVLRETAVHGVITNVELLAAVIADPVFRAGDLSTAFIEERLPDLQISPMSDRAAVAALVALEDATVRSFPGGVAGVWAKVGPFRSSGHGGWSGWLDDGVGRPSFETRAHGSDRMVSLDGRHLFIAGITRDESARTWSFTLDGVRTSAQVTLDVTSTSGPVAWVHCDGVTRRIEVDLMPRSGSSVGILGRSAFSSPMPGAVIVVDVAAGQSVRAGQTLMVLEAMKMEHPITAPVDGVVTALHVAVGATIDAGVVLLDFEATEGDESPDSVSA